MRKNTFVLILFLILGLLAGSLVARLAEQVDFLSFLTNSVSISWHPKADLDFLKYDFAFQVKLNLLNLMGLITAILLYRRM